MKMNKNKWLEYKIVELSYRGHNYREISSELQVSTGKVSKILHRLNLEAKNEIKTWIDNVTPFQYTNSFMLLSYLQKQTIKLVESSQDDRVKLEGVRALADLDAQKRQLLCDSFVINSAISTLQKQRKHEILENSKTKIQSQDTGFSQSKKEESEQNEQAKEK
jgi:hypothetical protein